MLFVVRETAQKVMIRLGEESLTAECVPEFRACLYDLIHAGVRELLIDFAVAKTIDSTGIVALLATRNSLCRMGGRIEIINASVELASLFHIIRLDCYVVVRACEGVTDTNLIADDGRLEHTTSSVGHAA